MNPQMRQSPRNSNPGPQSTTQANQNLQPPVPKPLARASTTFYARIITDWWWWELVSWFVSFSCFMAIVGILSFYDGKKQPSHVVKGITLNAFIAVFSAIARAAMILHVSECIGQLKWIWFKKERKLADFLAFDNASRGPWGSFVLLGTTMCRQVVLPSISTHVLTCCQTIGFCWSSNHGIGTSIRTVLPAERLFSKPGFVHGKCYSVHRDFISTNRRCSVSSTFGFCMEGYQHRNCFSQCGPGHHERAIS